MNKFAKGSLAAGAGLVLLLGGAGTLAYWNDSAELTGGTINAGKLQLTEAGSWTDGAPEVLVPGDSVTYSSTLTLDAQGDNIEGTIALDKGALINAAEGAVEDPTEQFDITVDVDETKASTGGGSLTSGADGVLQFEGAGTYTIPVTVTVDFKYDDTSSQNSSQNAAIDLGNVTFTATQTDPNAGE